MRVPSKLWTARQTGRGDSSYGMENNVLTARPVLMKSSAAEQAAGVVAFLVDDFGFAVVFEAAAAPLTAGRRFDGMHDAGTVEADTFNLTVFVVVAVEALRPVVLLATTEREDSSLLCFVLSSLVATFVMSADWNIVLRFHKKKTKY